MLMQCEGQIDLFSYLERQNVSNPPVLLKAGQEVWIVIKGDVVKYTVEPEKSWVCGINRYYRLKEVGGLYNCANNSEIGKKVFLNEESAKKIAEEYLNTHNIIRAEDIHPVTTVAYQYNRSVDGRNMIAFYSELDNGMVYIKEFVTYEHICTNKNKAIKKFMKQSEFEYCNPVQIDYHPFFKNMYRVRSDNGWDYSEAAHSYAIG